MNPPLLTCRHHHHHHHHQAVGGGTGFLIREPFTQLPTSHTEFSSFESSSATLKDWNCLIQKYRFSISIVLLRLPPSPNLFLVFLMNLILSFAAITHDEFIITGVFNIHLDNHSDHAISQFFSLLSSFNLTQHVNFPPWPSNNLFWLCSISVCYLHLTISQFSLNGLLTAHHSILQRFTHSAVFAP